MNFLGNQPQYGQPSYFSGIGSFLGTGNPQQVNEQAAQADMLNSGVNPDTAAIAAGMAADVVKLKTTLPRIVPGLTTSEINELSIAAAKTSEESGSGVRMGPSGMGSRGMGPSGMGPSGMGSRGMDPRGMGPRGMDPRGMDPRGMGYPVYGGRRTRRTRRRMQRGGCNGYSSSSLAFNAAPFTGGRRSRRRKSHKKRGKRSHRR